MLNASERSIETATKRLTDQSLLSLPPTICTILFVGITRCLDVYSLFQVEPMYLFFIGICPILKKCEWNFLGNFTRAGQALKSTSKNKWVVIQVSSSFHFERSVLFRKQCYNKLCGTVSEGKKNLQVWSQLFLQPLDWKVSKVVQQASDFASVDKISPFFAIFWQTKRTTWGSSHYIRIHKICWCC